MFIKPPCKQIIQFDNNTKRVIERAIRIEQGNWWHIMRDDGTETIVNKDRVLFIDVLKINDKKNERHN